MAISIPLRDVAKTKDVGQVSQFTLMRRRFMQSKLSLFGIVALLVLYAMAILSSFLAPYDPAQPDPSNVMRPPTSLTINGSGVAVCGTTQVLNTHNLSYGYAPDCSKAQPLQLLGQGYSYDLFGIIPTNRHLFESSGNQKAFLLGTDSEGRDLLARILAGARISLSFGLVAVAISTILGAVLGTVSGYFGGPVDTLMQRLVELLLSMPPLSLWMALTAAMPQTMPVTERYFLITLVLACIGWTALARQVRGKVMGYRSQDYASAARLAGASHWQIIMRHMMPNSFSHIIVTAALAIPAAILAETSLSFLGFGMLPPAISWGVLLRDAQQIQVVELHPWLLLPAALVIFAVTCFLLIGDGLRDAVDPYG
ncbi:MAG: ABC transporter permease [Candidatus Dormiibacterota bacterium]